MIRLEIKETLCRKSTAFFLYDNDGSVGAALGAGLGAGVFTSRNEAFAGLEKHATVEPSHVALYDELYEKWKNSLNNKLIN